MKEKIKLKKGISLTVLLITIAVMLILLTTITVSADNILNNTKKRQFAKEIYEVQNLVDKYKTENDDYPYIIENDENKTITINVENISGQFTSEDKVDNIVTLYPVNLSKAGVENLSRGTKKDNNENDVYAFSDKTGKVYYVKGYKVSSNTYYTLTDELKSLLGFKTKDSEKSNTTIVGESDISDEYVTDGLILHYDGIQNTRNGNNLYATTWEDLSGNNNDGILINTNNTIKYIGNGYEFTNNADYIETTNALGLSTDPNVTFEFVYKCYGTQDDNHNTCGLFTCGAANDDGIDSGRAISGNITNSLPGLSVVNIYIKCNISNKSNVVRNITFVKSQGTFSSATASIYENGKKSEVTQNGTKTMNFLDNTLQLGRSYQFQSKNRTLNGIIYAVRVYNRVLTEEEIKHNYATDKLRFNIE